MVSFHATGVYTDITSRVVRAVFTVAFFVLTWLIGLIAAFFLSWRNQSKLLQSRRSKPIPLNHLSSWLSEPDALWYLWYTRRLPGGRYGLLMITTGLFTLVSHVFVGLFINSVATPDRCTFIQGIVLDTLNNSTLPASQWPAADVAINAQIYSIRNGGLVGIYKKVASDEASFADPQFFAQRQDMAGDWTCTSTGSQDFPSSATLRSMVTSLQNSDDLYTAAMNNATGRLTSNRALMSLFVWSASVDNSLTPGPWDVKASIGYRDTQYDPFTIQNIHCDCTLEGPSKDLLSYIPSQATLDEWDEKLYGLLGAMNMKASDYDEYTATLTLGLNALTMAAGTGNIANRLLTETLAEPTYGCIVKKTLIQYAIFAALAILLGVLFLLIVASIFRRITSLRSKRSLVKDMPSDLVSWQVATLRDIFHDDTIKPKDLKQYSYGWIVQDQKVGYMKNGAPWARQPLSTPLLMNNAGPPMSTPSLTTPMTGYTPPVVQSPRSYFG